MAPATEHTKELASNVRTTRFVSREHATTFCLYVLAGLLYGISLSHPSYALGAWLAVVALAAGIHRCKSSFAVFGGVFLAHLLTRMIAFPWVLEMNHLLFPYSPAGMFGLALGEAAVWILPYALAAAVGHALTRRRVGVRWWLPVAWVLGDIVRFALVSQCIDDWLNTQWTVQPVLRALAIVGFWPLTIACLFASASLGQALASRNFKVALPGVVVITALLCAPPIAEDHADRLHGLGAIHTTSTVEYPAVVPDGLDYLIWPELALDFRPAILEGEGRGAVVSPLLPGIDIEHLIGLGTHVPGRTPQNQVVLVAADGRVRSSRAKRLLLPVAERRFLGVGKDNYHIGEATTVLKHAQRAFVAMICGEYLDRSLIAEGVRAGGEILAIVARDRWTDERADRQLLAIQVLRSVEFGLPSVRSSLMGQATFVAADGRVLARSSQQRNGVLTWDSQAGSRDLDFRGDPIGELADEEAPPQPAADVAVLYSEKAQHLRARCPGGRCSHFSLEGFTCPDKRHPAVIVSGHGRPPDYLSHPLDEVVAAIRCFEPELVIVDTCFGASSELVSALGDLDAVVVASPSLLPSSGFVYGAEFFTSTQRSLRAAAVNTQPNTELMRWQLNSGELTALLERVGAMNSEELGAHLARRNPSMIKVLLPNGSPVLVPVAWKRFGNSRPPPKRLRPRSHGRRRQP